MQEDTQAGMIYAYLEDYTGDRVCSKQLYEEALGNLNSPADWETRAICEIRMVDIFKLLLLRQEQTDKRFSVKTVQLFFRIF